MFTIRIKELGFWGKKSPTASQLCLKRTPSLYKNIYIHGYNLIILTIGTCPCVMINERIILL